MDALTTDLDRRIAQRQRRPQPATTGEGQGAADKVATANTPPQAAARKGDRWATYNAFVDVIAPRLTLAERAVWHVMFRHARDGRVETTARLLAAAANVSPSTAQIALNRLQRAGLVWPIWKSKDRAKASKYGMHPSPADCLPNVMQQDEPCR
jgi:hypothetical protein